MGNWAVLPSFKLEMVLTVNASEMAINATFAFCFIIALGTAKRRVQATLVGKMLFQGIL